MTEWVRKGNVWQFRDERTEFVYGETAKVKDGYYWWARDPTRGHRMVSGLEESLEDAKKTVEEAASVGWAWHEEAPKGTKFRR